MIEKMFSDFKTFTDQYNLVQDLPARTSGNGAVYHSDFIACCESYKVTPPQWAIDSLNSLEDPQNPGLIFRVPGDRHAYGHEGPDNPVAMLNAGRIIQNGYPTRFLSYMRQNANVFNQREPGKWRIKSDFSRFQHILTHAQWCAGETPGLFRKLWWAVAVLINAFQGEKQLSDHCLQFHLNQAARGKWAATDLVIQFWESRMKKIYGTTRDGWGGMRDKYYRGSVYYNGVEHPMKTWMSGRWK